jgi:phosphatidylethanolamine-binding protein (PEBP) family uncharacterized protein
MSMNKVLWTVVVVLGLAGCATLDTSKLPRMGVDFAFDQKHKCRGVSPEIRLSNVPAGAVSYEVTLTDLDVPSFNHWSQTLIATGPVIREAAGAGYFGPCPPSGTHRYEITVVARDSARQPIAYGQKTVVAGR